MRRFIHTSLLLAALFAVQTVGQDVKCEVKEKRVPFDNRVQVQLHTLVTCVFNDDTEITVPSKLTNSLNESVTDLRMVFNRKIEFLPQDIGIPFPKLRLLDAYGCAIKEITKLNFHGLTMLDKIVLNDNAIAKIDENSFDDLVELYYLFMDNNKITELPTRLFEQLGNLDTLYLNGNQIVELDANLFRANRNIALLHMNENKLRTLPAGIFDGLTKMRQIWLKSNEIVDLPANIFDQCESLIDVDLSRNRIKTIDPNLLSKLTELREVSFSFNPLDFIDLMVFDENTHLTEMYFNGISSTDIRNIERVDRMKNIKELSFHDGCVGDAFHEGNLEKLKEIVKMRCMAASKLE